MSETPGHAVIVDEAIHLRWPADRFYWVVIAEAPNADAAAYRDGTLDAAPFGEQIAEAVPVEPSLTHAALVGLKSGGVVACVALCADLDTLGSQVRTLRPVDAPDHLGDRVDADALDALNLLHGVYEPLVVRRARSAIHAAVWWSAAAVVTLAACGLHTRAWVDIRAAANLDDERQRLAERVLTSHPPEAIMRSLDAGEDRDNATPSGGRSTVHESLAATDAPARLETAYAVLQRERGDAVRGLRPADAGISLQALLHAWPRDLKTRIDSLTIGEASLRLSGSLDSLEDAATLTDALRSVPGWAVEQPQVSMLGDRATLRTTMLRDSAVKAPRGAGRPAGASASPIATNAASLADHSHESMDMTVNSPNGGSR